MRDLVDSVLEASIVGSFSRVGYVTRSRLGGWEPLPGMQGARVLVTGGSSGVGLAAAQMLAEAGARVVISGRDRDRLEAAADQVSTHGQRPVPVVAVRSGTTPTTARSRGAGSAARPKAMD